MSAATMRDIPTRRAENPPGIAMLPHPEKVSDPLRSLGHTDRAAVRRLATEPWPYRSLIGDSVKSLGALFSDIDSGSSQGG